VNVVRPNNLLAMLNRSEDAEFFSQLVEYSAERHAVLQRAGEPTAHVYFPVSGMISHLTVMADGVAVETAAVGYDNGLGFNTALSGRNSNTQLIVQLAMKSYRIASAPFCEAYARSAGVRHMVHVGNELLIEPRTACASSHKADRSSPVVTAGVRSGLVLANCVGNLT
jgi:hypothetical protein